MDLFLHVAQNTKQDSNFPENQKRIVKDIRCSTKYVICVLGGLMDRATFGDRFAQSVKIVDVGSMPIPTAPYFYFPETKERIVKDMKTKTKQAEMNPNQLAYFMTTFYHNLSDKEKKVVESGNALKIFNMVSKKSSRK